MGEISRWTLRAGIVTPVVNNDVITIQVHNIPELRDVLFVKSISVGMLFESPFFSRGCEFAEAIFESREVVHGVVIEKEGESDDDI
jgi:hypothetical protein